MQETKALTPSINEEGASDFLVGKITEESAQISKLHDPVRTYTILLKDDRGVVGGVDGYFFYGAYIIDVLWVEKNQRWNGVGTKLLKLVEDASIKENARFVQVSTMSHWQCSGFYEKNGYTKESVRDGYDGGLMQTTFIKKLTL